MPSRYVCVSRSAAMTLSRSAGSSVCLSQLPLAILTNPCPPKRASASKLSRTWSTLAWSNARPYTRTGTRTPSTFVSSARDAIVGSRRARRRGSRTRM